MTEDKKTKIDMADLHYYFDSQERDTLDRQGLSNRSNEVLRIRDKLLTLPEREFESAVQTIKTILQPGKPGDSKKDDPRNKRRDASELYDKARVDKIPANLKMGSV